MNKEYFNNHKILNKLSNMCNKCKDYFLCKNHEIVETLYDIKYPADSEFIPYKEHLKYCKNCNYREFYHMNGECEKCKNE